MIGTAFEIAAGLCLLVGGAFALIAGIGLMRFSDVFMRMHASTKAGTLGIGLIVAALALVTDDHSVATKAIGCVLFLLATAPVGAHLIGRAVAESDPEIRSRWRGVSRS